MPRIERMRGIPKPRKPRPQSGKWNPKDAFLTPEQRSVTKQRRKLEREKSAQRMKEILFPNMEETK
jgi:hypothetical protein